MRRIALLAFSIALFASAQDSQPPAPTPPKIAQNNKGETARKQAETPNYQSAADSLSAAISKLTSEVTTWKQQQSTERKKEDSSTDRGIMWSTIVTAAATIAIAVLAYFQWKTLKAHHTVMDRQADYIRDALKETRRSADAAMGSVDLLISRERARLVVSDMELANPMDATNIFVKLSIRNIGHSHAFQVEMRAACYLRTPSTGIPDLAPHFLGLLEKESEHNFIMVDVVPPISQDQLDATIQGTGVGDIRVYCVIKFIDVFGKKRVLRVGRKLFIPPIGGIGSHQWLLTEDPDDNRETEEAE